jgi:Tol biopolymer transport system component
MMQRRWFLGWKRGKRPLLGIWLLLFCLVSCSGGNDELESTAVPPVATLASRVTSTPPDLSALDISGRLLYLKYNDLGQIQLVQFDLSTGQQTVLYQPEPGSWLVGFDVSPDGQQLALSYVPLPEEGGAVRSNSLFVMPTFGARQPEHLAGNGSDEAFFAPVWAPDGHSIYSAVYINLGEGAVIPHTYHLEKVSYPDGVREQLIENALWPSVSPDGSRIAYLSFNSFSDVNDLYLADPDGANIVPALLPGTFPAVDAHFFSPDGRMIYFSAINGETPQSLSWLERLLGVQVAAAHDVPSDWWRVSLEGGEPERLTELGHTNLIADFSPDGEFIAFMGSGGVYVMRPDGSELTRLMDAGPYGALVWIR